MTTRLRALAGQVAMTGRFAGGLRRFLSTTSNAAGCRGNIAAALAARSDRFLAIMARGVYGRPASPYLALLRHAGVTLADLRALVEQHGVESALGTLYDAGVHITLDEFKGRRPIVRGSLKVPTSPHDFDNPLLTRHYEVESSGSSGPAARLVVDLDHVAYESCYEGVFLEAFDLVGRPYALWRPAPPGTAGLKSILRMARLGLPVERWFSQTRVFESHLWKPAVLTVAAWAIGRANGHRFPVPEHVPLDRADIVAQWLADHRRRGQPGHLNTTASSAVRVCLAARAAGLDISGSVLRVGGEPHSPAKSRVFNEAGCRAVNHYAMSEIGRIGVGCSQPAVNDEVHAVLDHVAVLQRACQTSVGIEPSALIVTTLSWGTPRIMLNVEVGDRATVSTRRCGCVWESLGYHTHLDTIRSYEKLTSEGMHFVGSDLLAVVEDVLPGRFGGGPTDYQFVEEEQANGLPRVSLVVSPRLGPLDDAAVGATALAGLGSANSANRMMAGLWRDGGTLQVVRREPHATGSGKTPALRIVRGERGLT